jgi:hypothetical protein
LGRALRTSGQGPPAAFRRRGRSKNKTPATSCAITTDKLLAYVYFEDKPSAPLSNKTG